MTAPNKPGFYWAHGRDGWQMLQVEHARDVYPGGTGFVARLSNDMHTSLQWFTPGLTQWTDWLHVPKPPKRKNEKKYHE